MATCLIRLNEDYLFYIQRLRAAVTPCRFGPSDVGVQLVTPYDPQGAAADADVLRDGDGRLTLFLRRSDLGLVSFRNPFGTFFLRHYGEGGLASGASAQLGFSCDYGELGAFAPDVRLTACGLTEAADELAGATVADLEYQQLRRPAALLALAVAEAARFKSVAARVH